VRLGQEAGTLLITAGKTLRSEYLAWASPNIVGFELQLFKTTSFTRKKL